jgi:hypothetical protein
MKDKLRNTGCPEAISLAILGHSTNTVAANYGSGYALEVMREALVRVWEASVRSAKNAASAPLTVLLHGSDIGHSRGLQQFLNRELTDCGQS